MDFLRNEEPMKTESLCLHAGYTPKNGEPRVVPIVQSTTFTYDSTADVAKLFDLETSGFFYTRLGNPTVDAVEQKIAALEGGVGALCTSSGQAANLIAILNLARSGDHVVSMASIYGGTFNLFAVTLKKMGIDVTFVDQRADDAEIEKAIRPNTKAVFGETLTNPSMDVLDIERIAALAHRHGLIRGAYHFFIPQTDPVKQADFFIRTVRLTKGDLPPVLDVETTGRKSVSELQKSVKTWLDRVEAHYGVKPILYASYKFKERYLNDSIFNTYPYWIAHYYVDSVRYTGPWHFWQHTDVGQVPGIEEDVDLNVFNGTLEELVGMTLP